MARIAKETAQTDLGAFIQKFHHIELALYDFADPFDWLWYICYYPDTNQVRYLRKWIRVLEALGIVPVALLGLAFK